MCLSFRVHSECFVLVWFLLIVTFTRQRNYFLVRGFTLSYPLDKVMVTGALPSPPLYTPTFLSRIESSVPRIQLLMLVDSEALH